MFQKLKKELGTQNIDNVEVSDVFWIRDKEKHQKELQKTNGNCCFNHQIDLPISKIPPCKEMPIFGYEMDIIENIERYKDYILNKARGIGATEIILRWILFCTIHNQIPSRKFLIITGIRGDLANEYITRISNLCKNIPYVRSKTQNKILINNSEIIALPANEDAIRGYENVGVIFADEAAHWDLRNDDRVLASIEPHRTKSDAHIIIVSTPNGRRGFFSKIFHDQESRFHKDTKPWTVSEGLLINREDVEKIKKEDFYRYEQEYDCQFKTTRYPAFPRKTLEKSDEFAEDYAFKKVDYGN